MRYLLIVLFCLISTLALGAEIILDGKSVEGRWVDGDTFVAVNAASYRISNVNSLEVSSASQYWGDWDRFTMLAFAKRASTVSASDSWHCSSTGKESYGRQVITCPDLARTLVSSGYAHVMSMRGPGPSDLLVLQARAQRQRLGMWEAGIPTEIVTSVGDSHARVVDTSTGVSMTIRLARVLPCQPVCTTGGACMLRACDR